MRLCVLWAGRLWSSIDSTLYIFTYYVGFVASGFYVVQFFLLLCVQNAVRRHRRKHQQWPGMLIPFVLLTAVPETSVEVSSWSLRGPAGNVGRAARA